MAGVVLYGSSGFVLVRSGGARPGSARQVWHGGVRFGEVGWGEAG
jgi:hypothetical protein